jgi:hypothetical protein
LPREDLRGASRLVISGIVGIVDIVEAMHYNVATIPALVADRRSWHTTGLTGLAYRALRTTIGLAGHGLDSLLARLEPILGKGSRWPGREALLAALNGVLGDYLAASSNPLAISMHLRRNGVALPLEREPLAAAIPHAGSRLLVLVHGLCMNDLAWERDGHDHGAALGHDLGYTPVYLHYNTGLHISTNGRAFAECLEALVTHWPVPLTELVLIGHSMGGLLVRSACHYGERSNHAWRHRLRKIVFLGTPHHGSPLERGGHWIDLLLGANRYSAPLARLGKVRSAGITDLRFGNLLDEDWTSGNRAGRDIRLPVPLPKGVACYAIAASAGNQAGDLGDRLLGDGIVPLASALGRHANAKFALTFEDSRQFVAYGIGHLDLLSRPEVYARIKHWLAETN